MLISKMLFSDMFLCLTPVQCSKIDVEFNRKHLSMGNFRENIRDIGKGNLGNQAVLPFTNLEKLLLVTSWQCICKGNLIQCFVYLHQTM